MSDREEPVAPDPAEERGALEAGPGASEVGARAAAPCSAAAPSPPSSAAPPSTAAPPSEAPSSPAPSSPSPRRRTWLRLKLALLALTAIAPFPLVGVGVYQGCEDRRRSEREHQLATGLDRLLAALVRVVDASERLEHARLAAARRPGRVPTPRELAELVQAEAMSAHEAALIAALAGEPTVEDRAAELDAVVDAARRELASLSPLGLDREAAEARVLASEAAARARGDLADVSPLRSAVDLIRARDGLAPTAAPAP